MATIESRDSLYIFIRLLEQQEKKIYIYNFQGSHISLTSWELRPIILDLLSFYVNVKHVIIRKPLPRVYDIHLNCCHFGPPMVYIASIIGKLGYGSWVSPLITLFMYLLYVFTASVLNRRCHRRPKSNRNLVYTPKNIYMYFLDNCRQYARVDNMTQSLFIGKFQ